MPTTVPLMGGLRKTMNKRVGGLTGKGDTGEGVAVVFPLERVGTVYASQYWLWGS